MKIDTDDTDFMELISLGKMISLPPRTVVLSEGQISQKLLFIVKGIVRLYTYKNGNEITVEFFKEGDIVASAQSFIRKEPSEFTIETIIRCDIIEISRELFDSFFLKNNHFREKMTMSIIERLFQFSKHLVSYIKETPQERYINLMKNDPDLIQRVPQIHISSYLGITPESLSRLRKRISRR